MDQRTCTIPRCEKPARTKSAEWCAMHYHRWYRNGSPGEATPRTRKERSPHCEVGGCLKPDREGGLCYMHAARMRRHGDVEKVVSPQDRDLPTGPDNHNWMGDEAGYTASHDRVRRARGPAHDYICECGDQAAHWSYNHDDPNERVTFYRSDRGIAYSTSIDHYTPRCVPCHKSFDIGRINAMKV